MHPRGSLLRFVPLENRKIPKNENCALRVGLFVANVFLALGPATAKLRSQRRIALVEHMREPTDGESALIASQLSTDLLRDKLLIRKKRNAPIAPIGNDMDLFRRSLALNPR
jgi:hypothetical protein